VIGQRFRRPGDATVWTVDRELRLDLMSGTAPGEGTNVGMGRRVRVWVLVAGDACCLATTRVLNSARWVPVESALAKLAAGVRGLMGGSK
jgi:hypothetical protein